MLTYQHKRIVAGFIRMSGLFVAVLAIVAFCLNWFESLGNMRLLGEVLLPLLGVLIFLVPASWSLWDDKNVRSLLWQIAGILTVVGDTLLVIWRERQLYYRFTISDLQHANHWHLLAIQAYAAGCIAIAALIVAVVTLAMTVVIMWWAKRHHD